MNELLMQQFYNILWCACFKLHTYTHARSKTNSCKRSNTSCHISIFCMHTFK